MTSEQRGSPFQLGDMLRLTGHYRKETGTTARFHVYAEDREGLAITYYDGQTAGAPYRIIDMNDQRFELVERNGKFYNVDEDVQVLDNKAYSEKEEG